MSIIEIRNPATGQRTGSVDRTPLSEFDSFADRARRSQTAWSRLPFAARAGIFRRFHDRVIDRSSEVLDAIQSETGKSRRDALAELVTAQEEGTA